MATKANGTVMRTIGIATRAAASFARNIDFYIKFIILKGVLERLTQNLTAFI
jgi:hypothetical protein